MGMVSSVYGCIYTRPRKARKSRVHTLVDCSASTNTPKPHRAAKKVSRTYECDDYDGERFLRLQEEYGAYLYAGCTSSFWEDVDAGYVGNY